MIAIPVCRLISLTAGGVQPVQDNFPQLNVASCQTVTLFGTPWHTYMNVNNCWILITFRWRGQIFGVRMHRFEFRWTRLNGENFGYCQWLDLTDWGITVVVLGSLQIRRSVEDDEGSYECVAENSVGLAISYGANLYVRGQYSTCKVVSNKKTVFSNRNDFSERYWTSSAAVRCL